MLCDKIHKPLNNPESINHRTVAVSQFHLKTKETMTSTDYARIKRSCLKQRVIPSLVYIYIIIDPMHLVNE